jgi:hypothetical protein
LVDELLRALEDAGGRARGAAGLVAGYCRAAGGERREALQEHADALLTVGGVAWGGGCLVCGGVGWFAGVRFQSVGIGAVACLLGRLRLWGFLGLLKPCAASTQSIALSASGVV